ncbi:MAG: dipeptide epimerase [Alphaproteobacteria bacterium]|nr:MAG: dipeptide epimerase [Alphaproteobacteria bacterium]
MTTTGTSVPTGGTNPPLVLDVREEVWPYRSAFTISRGTRTESRVVVARLSLDLGNGRTVSGRGECMPYPRYGESVEGVIATIESLRPALAAGLDRAGLQEALPPGAARNALDCAFWDLEAKRSGRRVWQLAGLPAPEPVTTAYTLSLDAAEAMGRAAAAEADRPVLKLKLSGPHDLARVEAVRANAPGARLIVDANEGWSVEDYVALAPRLAALGVALIEQPLPAADDAALAVLDRPVPVCADESCHDTASLAHLAGRYDAINIKLDKTGGLSEALRLRRTAQERGFAIMVGCMLGTSLAMAPAVLVAQGARVVDLDGPLLLARDRDHGLRYEGSLLHPPAAALWG